MLRKLFSKLPFRRDKRLLEEVKRKYPKLIQNGIVTDNITYQLKSFETQKNTYYITSAISEQSRYKYLELSRELEFGRTDVHQILLSMFEYINTKQTGWNNGDVMNIAVSLGEALERTSPEFYANDNERLLKICTIFCKTKNEGDWTEELAEDKIKDWRTGIKGHEDNIGFFLFVYELSKMIYMGRQTNTHLTSYMNMMKKIGTGM